jgi:hypothetical protein
MGWEPASDVREPEIDSLMTDYRSPRRHALRSAGITCGETLRVAPVARQTIII